MTTATDQDLQANEEAQQNAAGERDAERAGLHGPPTAADLPKPLKTMRLTEDEITAYAMGRVPPGTKRVLTQDETNRVATRHMELSGGQQADHGKQAHELKMQQRKAEVEAWEVAKAPAKRGPGRPPGTSKKQAATFGGT